MSKAKGLDGLRITRPAGTEQTVPRPPARWFTRRVVPLAILIAALLLMAYAARESLRPALPVRTLAAVGKSVQGSSGTVTVQAPGWVEADPYPIYVPALAPGVVEEVLVLEGQAVRAGQVVVRLIDEDARLTLQQAQARRAISQARLEAAQADWDHPIELDRRVAVAEASLERVQAEREQLLSEIAMEQAKLNELEDRHRRIAGLLPDAAAKQQVIQVGLQRDAQRALLEATRKKQAVLAAQETAVRVEHEAAREQRRLRIDQRQALDRARAELHQAEAVEAEAALRLERMAVRSPAAGIVMSRLAVPGSKLMLDMDSKLSANAVHLYDPNRLQVRVDVPLADASQVGIDQPAEITVDVLPDTRFNGRVTRIVHEADIQKNTLEVKVAIFKPTPQLKPEMLARVKFIGRQTSEPSTAATQRVFVPERLLQQRSGDTARIWLIDSRGRATLREISLGRAQQDGWIETVAGLNPGDPLIDEAPGTLTEGKYVRITGDSQP